MAKTQVPGPLERRHLLERELDAARALRCAEAYLEEGRSLESVAFFAKAEAADRVAGLAAQAVEDGDAFLLRTLEEEGGLGHSPEMWERLAERAESAGKNLYAAMARRQTEIGGEG